MKFLKLLVLLVGFLMIVPASVGAANGYMQPKVTDNTLVNEQSANFSWDSVNAYYYTISAECASNVYATDVNGFDICRNPKRVDISYDGETNGYKLSNITFTNLSSSDQEVRVTFKAFSDNAGAVLKQSTDLLMYVESGEDEDKVNTVAPPSCDLDANKSVYNAGELVTFSWTSSNSTYTSFQQNSAATVLKLPGDKNGVSGSHTTTFTNTPGKYTASLLVGGTGGQSNCTDTIEIKAVESQSDDDEEESTPTPTTPSPTTVSSCPAQFFPNFFTRDLTDGSTGLDVTTLQNLLIDQGYLTIPAGTNKGYFGFLTRLALTRYQNDHGIFPANGNFGITTRDYMKKPEACEKRANASTGQTTSTNSCPANFFPNFFTRDLTDGSTGLDVTSLQNLLIAEGYLSMPPGVQTGYFGFLTKLALARFQNDRGIFPENGYFGITTRDYMKSGKVCVVPTSSSSSSNTSSAVRIFGLKDSYNFSDVISGDESFEFTWSPRSVDIKQITFLHTALGIGFVPHAEKVRSDEPITNGRYNLNTFFENSFVRWTDDQIEGSLKQSLPESYYLLELTDVDGNTYQSKSFRIYYDSTSNSSNTPAPSPTTTSSSCPASYIPSLFTRDLTLGSTGLDVIQLQFLLEAKGFLTIPAGVDRGYFGPATGSALARYQASIGMSPAVGYFGANTRNYLKTQDSCAGGVSTASKTVSEIAKIEAVGTVAGDDDDWGVYTIVFDVTALNEDVNIINTVGTTSSSAVQFAINSQNGFYGETTMVLVSSAPKSNSLNRWTVKKGETERFTLTVRLDPIGLWSGKAYGISLEKVFLSVLSNSKDYVIPASEKDDFKTSQIIID